MNKYEQLLAIKKIQISIATKDQVMNWSKGEVTKPETINYKTYKPEKDGLFDEKIFGPIKDYVCPICGKKHKRADVGKMCSSCGKAEIQSKMTRRRYMGHIALAADIAHIWYTKVDYSVIRSILGLSQDELDSLIYFKSHIVYDNAGIKSIKPNTLIDLQHAPSIYRKILNSIKDLQTSKQAKQEIADKIAILEEESKGEMGQNYGIDFYDYNDFISLYSDVKIGTGAEAVKILLSKLKLNTLEKELKKQISTKIDSSALYRKLKVVESFIKSKQNPADMIINVIPVIPADLRPLIQLDGGRHSTVDVNELYRRVIIRNNRLKQWQAVGAPWLIVQNEKRMLQESVDALFDNTRKKNPVLSKDNRPLKSLAENLKGKQGRFRQNLLGKRVDYSGRSVIVVGPELQLHQVGLPKQMIVKLFEPFIVKSLVDDAVVKNIKQAKKMIELLDDKIWKYAGRVIKNHPVLLNRAPTLHRLSIQAFEPVITSGKAIRLHPLVTQAFNADFDGDQMAVHIPLSKKAKEEAWTLMLSSRNVLGPKDGKLILTPSQDIVLGTYYLTKVKAGLAGGNQVYKSIIDIKNLISLNKLSVHAIIALPISVMAAKFKHEKEHGYKYFVTTVGRLLLNEKLPEDFTYINEVNSSAFNSLDKKYLAKDASELVEIFNNFASYVKPFKKAQLANIIENVFEKKADDIAYVLDAVKALGFEYSMWSGASMAITDIVDVKEREEIIKLGEKKVEELNDLFKEGFLTDDQRYLQVLKVWADVREEVRQKLQVTLDDHKDNSLFMMMDSGARGNISNFVQLAGLRGSMAKATHEYAALKRQGILVRSIEEIPVKSSFKIGLNPFEYFLSTHGARKGLSDTATKTAESGYLTRRLVDAVQDVLITSEDCNTNEGIIVKPILDTRTKSIIESISERLQGRYAAEDIKIDGKVVVKKNHLITNDLAKLIEDNKVENVKIRSVLTCNQHRGLCKKCYGIDLTTGQEVNIGEAVGIVSAQSIGEPGTQLTMRTFHTGGIAGVADITQGFARLMEIVDANKNPKSASVISEIEGKVTSIKHIADRTETSAGTLEIIVKNKHEQKVYQVESTKILRVKEGSEVKAGSKITEGSIPLQELLRVAGSSETQYYIIKEMQRLYRLQGINISDKYMEVIIRQMLSKIQIVDPGDSDLYTSQIISKDQLSEINLKLFEAKKKPAYGRVIILGVKPLPLHSESFLAAASYQRTAEVLVNASIMKKKDSLYGVKENLIIGKEIPVGTGRVDSKGKYAFINEQDYDEQAYYDAMDEENLDLVANDTSGDEIRVVNELHDVNDYNDGTEGGNEF